MHLVVTGSNIAVRPEDIGAVGDLVADFDGQRADMDVQMLLAGKIAQSMASRSSVTSVLRKPSRLRLTAFDISGVWT